MAISAAAAAAAALSFPRALPSPLQPRRHRHRRRSAEPPACAHSERGVTFDPGSAFYRSDSAAGRDLAVLAATLHRRAAGPSAPFLCLDAMCGCGVRALRYLAQAGADFVWANDASEALRPVIVGNLSRFERAPDRRWAVSHLDATRLLSERYLRREYFDVIDVDSFGGDAAYIRAALLALRIGGLLYLTSTDWRSARGYGSRSNYGFICHCKSCGQSRTFGFDELGQITCGCADKIDPDSITVVGPLWTGPLHDTTFLTEMLSLATEWGWANTIENGVSLEKLLDTMIEESDSRLPPGYIRLDEIASRAKVNSPPLGTLINSLRKEGYAACRSHIGANAIKTNCPIECCLDVAQEIRNLR
uniref:tRNA (guanine(26)-N(2))-dimethyltransferase n=1 Tax=Oryza barthii TaxID=65489 RepID=A0A0D3G635_9ORYZ